MAKIDQRIKTIFIGTLVWLVFLSMVGAYFYFDYQQRQAEREVIYLKARALARQEQQKRVRDYQKRLMQRRLTQEFNQGRVVNPNQPAKPAAPADAAAQK